MADSEPKLCINCKWMRPTTTGYVCAHPSSVFAARLDLVTGIMQPAQPLSCSTARSSMTAGRCGEAGIHFEERILGERLKR
jgi:hypothetical protein